MITIRVVIARERRRFGGVLAFHLLLLFFMTALATRACGQEPALIVIRLTGVGELDVAARLTADSSLELPAGAVRDLLGVTVASPWVSVAALAREYPAVSFEWLPRVMLLVVTDPRLTLPASRAAVAAAQRAAQRTPALAYRTVSGPFGAITADDRGRSQLDAGYTWRQRLALSGAYRPAARRDAWAWTASVAPVRQLTLGASGTPAGVTSAARVSAGPLYALATWERGRAQLDGLVALGPVAVFASTRQTFLVTIQRSGVALQVGRTPSTTTARLFVGPQPVSPFFLPSPSH